MRSTVCVLTCIFLAFSCGLGGAAPILSFANSPADLQNLSVGAPVTIKVELTELDANIELDSLAATVTFDGQLLGVPVVIAGQILPNPLHGPMDLVTARDPGFADVAFLTFGENSNDHVVTNGTFFSIEVAPVNVGSGTFLFDFSGATQFDVAGPIIVELVTGPSLDFSVVPEPTSSLLSLVLGALVFLLHSRCYATSNCCKDK